MLTIADAAGAILLAILLLGLRDGETMTVPALVGLTASDAVRAIRDAGLEPRVRFVSSSRPGGTVLGQSPDERTETPAGTTVVLEVAKSRPAVQRLDVPDVVGMTEAAARRALRAAGFSVAITGVPSAEPAGTVIAQPPRAGVDVHKGSSVELRVSTGRADVDVPEVTGMDQQSATLGLEKVRVIDEPTTDPAQDGLVIRQTPPGGSSTTEGAVVTLTVARLG
jgi:eukaryotic-like serine/threonine-protein kinase